MSQQLWKNRFALQAASHLLQQAIHIRQKYMAVSHQHFSPECSQILRERSPEVTFLPFDQFSFSTQPQPNDLGDPSFFVGMRPRVQSLGKLSLRVGSSLVHSCQQHPIHDFPIQHFLATFRSIQSTLHQRGETIGAAPSPLPWDVSSSSTRASSPQSGDLI